MRRPSPASTSNKRAKQLADAKSSENDTAEGENFSDGNPSSRGFPGGFKNASQKTLKTDHPAAAPGISKAIGVVKKKSGPSRSTGKAGNSSR